MNVLDAPPRHDGAGAHLGVAGEGQGAPEAAHGQGRVSAWAAGLARQPLALAALFLLLYGFNTTDFDDFARLTRDPFTTLPDVERQFLHSSPLGFFLGWPLTRLFGAEASFASVCALGVLTLSAAFWLYLRGRAAEDRRVIGSVFLSTPLLLVLCRWLGKSDAYLLASYLALLACGGRAVLRMGFALLLVATHREIGSIILIGDAVLRRRLDLPIVLGASVGIALVALYNAELSVRPFSRIDIGMSFLKRGVLGWLRVPASHLLLSFSWFWTVLFAVRRTIDGPRVALVVALCFALGLAGADVTRVVILCAMPLVAYTAERAAATPSAVALLTRSPFPLLFLMQIQVESFDQITDSQWPMAAARLFHNGF